MTTNEAANHETDCIVALHIQQMKRPMKRQVSQHFYKFIAPAEIRHQTVSSQHQGHLEGTQTSTDGWIDLWRLKHDQQQTIT